MSHIVLGLDVAFRTQEAELAVAGISPVGQKDTKAQKWVLIR